MLANLSKIKFYNFMIIILCFFEIYKPRYRLVTKFPYKFIYFSSPSQKSYLLMIQIYFQYLSYKKIHLELICKAKTAKELI